MVLVTGITFYFMFCFEDPELFLITMQLKCQHTSYHVLYQQEQLLLFHKLYLGKQTSS